MYTKTHLRSKDSEFERMVNRGYQAHRSVDRSIRDCLLGPLSADVMGLIHLLLIAIVVALGVAYKYGVFNKYINRAEDVKRSEVKPADSTKEAPKEVVKDAAKDPAKKE
ncbi:hypothetical protein QR680_010530 [Steinernema hermaphroditum]|uniref:Uncharacterized protein n=1 Tax=Steinernema hermaphroditum TaxID=289476 RepID=A0AA39IQX2_9BILA|nr:hypothetical protein QR680_010530 [Steinernema hermaphroditum]